MGTPTCAYQQQQHAHHGQRRLGAREPDWQLCKHHPLRLDLRCEQLRLCTQGKQHPQRSLRGLRLGCPQHRREVWKLQDTKAPTRAEQWKCTKYVLLTHFTVELPQIWGFHPLAEYFGMSTHQVPFPSLMTMAPQILGFFLFEDFFHYWAHRALHWGPLYKKIHKLHHEFSAPFGLAAEYAHPLEILILGTGTIAGPLLWCLFSKGNLHIITMYVWIILRLFQAVDAHSGYDFPWSFQHIFPLWSGADHHDHHHQFFIGNYSTSFRIWDYVFGTEGSYRLTRQKQRDEKKAAKEALRLKKEGFKTVKTQ